MHKTHVNFGYQSSHELCLTQIIEHVDITKLKNTRYLIYVGKQMLS
jgi:hypothetical protein